MRCVAAVWLRDYVATESRRAAWPAMATRATVDETGTDRRIGVDVSDAILRTRAKTLGVSEFSLEQLTSASYRSSRIAHRDESR